MASSTLFDIADRVVIVTGATGALAGSAANYLAAQGARVVYLGRGQEKVDAALSPLLSRYLRNLARSCADKLIPAPAIMQSNGGVMTLDVARDEPVMMMESGPVGGIIASAEVGKALGFRNVVSFDMGGTTAKASLVRDGEPTLAPGYYVGGYASGHPVMLPMIDVVEVGAGGGEDCRGRRGQEARRERRVRARRGPGGAAGSDGGRRLGAGEPVRRDVRGGRRRRQER